MKQSIVATAVVVTLAAALGLTTANEVVADDRPSAARPNVVLFLVDDMGWMDSTPYGSQYYETPNMKRLARQSMRFTGRNGLVISHRRTTLRCVKERDESTKEDNAFL